MSRCGPGTGLKRPARFPVVISTPESAISPPTFFTRRPEKESIIRCLGSKTFIYPAVVSRFSHCYSLPWEEESKSLQGCHCRIERECVKGTESWGRKGEVSNLWWYWGYSDWRRSRAGEWFRWLLLRLWCSCSRPASVAATVADGSCSSKEVAAVPVGGAAARSSGAEVSGLQRRPLPMSG